MVQVVNMSFPNTLRVMFQEGNISKILALLSQKFNMNVKYVAGESTYQVDPSTGHYVEVTQ